MSSIFDDPNPNPNPQNPKIILSSNRKKKKKKNSKRRRNSKKKPNWLELPEDVWFLILSNLTTFDILENAQKVCMMFRKICKQPSMFRSIDMSLADDSLGWGYSDEVFSITRFAVDRSAGGLVDIYVESVDDDTLSYIADRSKDLKHLRLGLDDISKDGLVNAMQKLPMLEEVQLICPNFPKVVEVISHTLSPVKSFSLTEVGVRKSAPVCNNDAFAIAKSMPLLRHLQLIGNKMSNEGLKAILDGCPLIESLDLHACFHIDLSGDLGKRCALIKSSWYCDDPSKDYGRQAYEKEDTYGWSRDSSDYEYSDDRFSFDLTPEFVDFGDLEDGYFDGYDDYDDDLNFFNFIGDEW